VSVHGDLPFLLILDRGQGGLMMYVSDDVMVMIDDDGMNKNLKAVSVSRGILRFYIFI
jgi:hypothetical protein